MNKSFKVVFNKARGALMVVNEVTSSVQAKGTKTVIAAAVATMVAGGAVAADLTWEELDKKTDWTYVNLDQDGKVTEIPGLVLNQKAELKAGESIKVVGYDAGESAANALNGLHEPNSAKIVNNGLIYVDANKINNHGVIGMSASWNKDAQAINNGEIYVKATDSAQVAALAGNKGDTLVNNKLIKVEGKNSYGILVWRDAGTELADSTTITNAGTIMASGEGSTGVRFGVNTGQNTLTNKGAIIAKDKAVAVSINDATFNMEAGSTVEGQINAERVAFNLNGNKGTLSVKATDSTIHVNDGAEITLADNQKSTYETVNVNKGTLTASIWKDDNHMKNVVVGEEGVFNITKLNSGGDKDNLATKPHDTLLLSRNQSFTFNDSALYVDGKVFTGKLKVGQLSNNNDTHKGTVAFNGGNHAFEYLTIGSDSKVTIAQNGKLDLGTLHLYQKGENGKVGGEIVVDNASLSADKLTFETNAKGITLNNGTFTTGHANLFKDKALTAAASLITGNGVIDVADWTGEYTLDDVKKAQAKFNADGAIQVTFTNGKLNAKAEDLTAQNVQGMSLADATGVATDGAFDVSTAKNDTVLAAINFGSKEVADKSVNIITGSHDVVLSGNDGDVFKNLKATTETVAVDGSLVLGDKATSTGNVNVKNLQANKLTVVGDFVAHNVDIKTAGTVTGVLTVDTLKTTDADGIDVSGSLVVNGAFDKDGKALADITGKVNVKGEGALLTTNKAAAQNYIATLDDETTPAVLYVDRALKLADGAEVVVGGQVTKAQAQPQPQAPAANNASITVENGGYALVDASKFVGSKDAVFGENTNVAVNNGGELNLINVNKTGEVKLGASVTVQNGELDTDSLYLNAKAGDKGVVAINYRDGVLGDKVVDARLKDLFKKGASAKEMTILNALDKDVYLDTKTDTFNALGNKAFEQATGGNATAGVFNVAYDANAQVTDAIVRHQLAEKTHMGAWADVFYAKNEAKEMYGNSGYSADIYGGVLGFDATFSCGATSGVAIAMGKADAESEGGVFANKLDSDFWGVSVYTAKDFDGLNVKADLGYMDFSNDFSGLGDASDASTVTFGVRGDYTAYQNGAFSVAPHFGLRYTHIDTDAVAFNDAQTMNVFEAPIGVKFAGTFETTGWKVVPSYDFTIVPQFGDKEVEAFGTTGDVTILNGGLVNNVIGVEASKGNLSFGLNGVYGVGAHDRANTQINANVRYNF